MGHGEWNWRVATGLDHRQPTTLNGQRGLGGRHAGAKPEGEPGQSAAEKRKAGGFRSSDRRGHRTEGICPRTDDLRTRIGPAEAPGASPGADGDEVIEVARA